MMVKGSSAGSLPRTKEPENKLRTRWALQEKGVRQRNRREIEMEIAREEGGQGLHELVDGVGGDDAAFDHAIELQGNVVGESRFHDDGADDLRARQL